MGKIIPNPGGYIIAQAKFTAGWTTVGIVKSNRLTVWVELTDGAIVKRRWNQVRL